MADKHLTLNDIFIGDIVEEVSPMTMRPSMPMRVSAIFEDGDLYLDFKGNEGDPWEAKISECRDVEIDFYILKDFGFFEAEYHLYQKEQGDWIVRVQVYKFYKTFLVNAFLFDKDGKIVLLGSGISTIRILQHRFYYETGEPLKLELV